MTAFPLPRLALAVEVADDARATATFTITNGKGSPAVLDFGDGTQPVEVVLSGGSGTRTHPYSEPGHHVYTATVTVPCPVHYADWTALAAANAEWEVLPDAVDTWADTDRSAETASTPVTVDVGPATIWAEAQATPYPHVDIDTWVGDPETVVSWSITREAVDAVPQLNTMIIFLTGKHPSGFSIEDREAPIGVAVRYRMDVTRASGAVDSVWSEPVTITGTSGCWLTSTVTGQTMPVTVIAWDTRTRKARVTYLAVANRPDPVALSDRHLWPSGTVVFGAHNRPQLDALVSILLTGYVLLRTQPGSSLETAYFSVGDFDENRADPGNGANWARSLPVAVQEIAPIPATARPSSTTWGTVGGFWPTWTALAADMPTWQDVGQWRGPVVYGAAP